MVLFISVGYAFDCFTRARPGVRWVHSCLFGSFGRPPMFVGFIRVCFVHSGAPRWSSGLFGFVWFIRACIGGRRVHWGALQTSSCLFGGAPWLHSRSIVRAHRQSSCSLVFVQFIRARPWSRLVHSGWFGSFQRAPGDVVFICCIDSFGCAPVVVGFFRVRLVHSGVQGRWSSSFGLDRVHSGSLRCSRIHSS